MPLPHDSDDGTNGPEDFSSLGLPHIRSDGDCVTPLTFPFENWVHGPDSVITATVTDVRLNKEIVYSTSTTPPEEIAWSACDEASVTGVSLIVDLDHVQVLAGEPQDSSLSIVVGAGDTGQWVPTPFWNETAGLSWGGQGEVLGPQMELGAALFWDADRKVWSGQWLFEVEPDGGLFFPQEADRCIHLPPELTSNPTKITLLADAARTVKPDASILDAYRKMHMPDDPHFRAYSKLATLCLDESYMPEEPPTDPEANP